MATFPLPLNFFHCIPLRNEERTHLQAKARQMARDVFDLSQISNEELNWKLMRDYGDAQVYEGLDKKAPHGVVSWIGTTTVMGSLDEVRQLFVCHSTTEYRDLNYIVSRHDILDCAHLYTLSDSEAEHIDIRWVATKAAVKGVALPRDLVTLDIQQPFEWEGRNGYIVAFSHVDVKCCPDFRKSLGLVRMRVHRGGYVFLETDKPGEMQATQLYQLNPGGNLPRWVMRAIMKLRLKNVREIDRFLREKRLSLCNFLPDTDLIPLSKRSKCFLCQTKFSLLKSKAHCRKCGEVFCRVCTKEWTVQNAGIDMIVTVCTPCSFERIMTPTEHGTMRPRVLPFKTVYSPSTFVHPLILRSPYQESSVASPIYLQEDEDLDFIEDNNPIEVATDFTLDTLSSTCFEDESSHPVDDQGGALAPPSSTQ
ncbi:hypothetical protein AeMF1_003661 [Aphanomyces euteiches]|nr:hypothetical protein AeMF1_003661 [Aphanomyces euteiches]KAH9189273.1 hypothetical protein AeNC1_008745 [Aphanomyces euteiches]